MFVSKSLAHVHVDSDIKQDCSDTELKWKFGASDASNRSSL